MEDEEMKSALEITMEKVSSMPRLTEEEVQLQKEREFLPRGVAIANRYLQGDLREQDLQLEICRFQGREAEIVQKACLLTLCQAIKLEDIATSLRAVEGIQAARSNAGLVEIRQEIEAIFNEFNQQLDQKRDQFEMTEKEKLQQLGISGSAVKPNIKNNKTWQQQFIQIQSPFTARLDKLRVNLSQLLGLQ